MESFFCRPGQEKWRSVQATAGAKERSLRSREEERILQVEPLRDQLRQCLGVRTHKWYLL